MVGVLLALLLCLLSPVVFAAAGGVSQATINVRGDIRAVPCRVYINGSEQFSAVIQLPPVSKSRLTKLGDTAGEVKITLSALGCSNGEKAALQVSIDHTLSDINSSGRLNNSQYGGAKNIELQVADRDFRVLNLDVPSSSTLGVLDSTGQLIFYVRYFAIGAAQSGVVSSALIYLLEPF